MAFEEWDESLTWSWRGRILGFTGVEPKWRWILTAASVVLPGIVYWVFRSLGKWLFCLVVIAICYRIHLALGIAVHAGVIIHSYYLMWTYRREFRG